MPRRPFPHVEEARALMDSTMARYGYRLCKQQPSGYYGSTVRLYTMDASGGTNNGGLSVSVDHELLKGKDWPWYVEAQMQLALSRKT